MAVKKGQLEDSTGSILHFETEASLVTTDASNRFVTDAQISDWNSRATGSHTHSNYMPHTYANGYYGMTGNGDADAWVRTTTNGLIPVKSGGPGAGSSSIGTSSWYFSNSYIDHMYGNLEGTFGGIDVGQVARYYKTSGSVDISDTNLKQFYGTCVTASASAPSTDWWHIMNIPHQDSNGYGAQLALGYHGSHNIYMRTANGTSWASWVQVLTKDNVNANIIVSASDPGGSTNDIWVDITNFVFKVRLSNATWRIMGAAYN